MHVESQVFRALLLLGSSSAAEGQGEGGGL